MKTASELISFLVKDKHFSLCSVCELHKPCATTPRCSWEPAKRFVNFDDVKTAYCKEHQVAEITMTKQQPSLQIRWRL